MMNGMCWGGMWFVPIFCLVILGMIIWAVLTFKNKSHRDIERDTFPRQESALDILKKRYARGEITKDDFEQMKRDLL